MTSLLRSSGRRRRCHQRDHDFPVHDRIRLHAVVGHVQRLLGGHVVAPAMGAAGDDAAVERTRSQRLSLMEAGILHGVEVPSTLNSATSLSATVTTVPLPGGSPSRRATSMNSATWVPAISSFESKFDDHLGHGFLEACHHEVVVLDIRGEVWTPSISTPRHWNVHKKNRAW